MKHSIATRGHSRLLAVLLVLGLALIVVGLGLNSIPVAQAQGPTGTPEPASRMSPPRGAIAPVPAPAAQPGTPDKAAKKAVVVKSWQGCQDTIPVWDDLNINWSHFGKVPVSIDYSNPNLCTGSITLAALQAENAHTVILSDPAGGNRLYSSSDISAIQQYAQSGHNVLGTYLVLYNYLSGTDDRGLAVLFGLDPNASYGGGAVIPTFNELKPKSFLFAKIGNPYVSGSYPSTQWPADGSWDNGDQGSSKYKATTAGKSAVILQYNYKGTHKYRAVYITSMPEFGGNAADEQFLYNVLSH